MIIYRRKSKRQRVKGIEKGTRLESFKIKVGRKEERERKRREKNKRKRKNEINITLMNNFLMTVVYTLMIRNNCIKKDNDSAKNQK